MTRAFKIDPKAMTVELIELRLGQDAGATHLHELIGDIACTGARFPNGDRVMVDDNGLAKPELCAFKCRYHPDLHWGVGIVTHFDQAGETVPAKSSLDQVKDAITWRVVDKEHQGT
jgi:hypothetical protein